MPDVMSGRILLIQWLLVVLLASASRMHGAGSITGRSYGLFELQTTDLAALRLRCETCDEGSGQVLCTACDLCDRRVCRDCGEEDLLGWWYCSRCYEWMQATNASNGSTLGNSSNNGDAPDGIPSSDSSGREDPGSSSASAPTASSAPPGSSSGEGSQHPRYVKRKDEREDEA